jgi:hypothetical protein
VKCRDPELLLGVKRKRDESDDEQDAPARADQGLNASRCGQSMIEQRPFGVFEITWPQIVTIFGPCRSEKPAENVEAAGGMRIAMLGYGHHVNSSGPARRCSWRRWRCTRGSSCACAQSSKHGCVSGLAEGSVVTLNSLHT